MKSKRWEGVQTKPGTAVARCTSYFHGADDIDGTRTPPHFPGVPAARGELGTSASGSPEHSGLAAKRHRAPRRSASRKARVASSPPTCVFGFSRRALLLTLT